MNKITIVVYVTAFAALAACHNGGNDAVAPPVTSKLADSEINNNTNEMSMPIAINDLPVTSDEFDETSSPVPI